MIPHKKNTKQFCVDIASSTLRAQRLKMFNLAWKIHSLSLKILNLAWNIQSLPPEFPPPPHKNRGLVGGPLEIFNPGGRSWFFSIFGPFPVLPFLDFSVSPRKNSQFTKDFCPLPNPLKPWESQRKRTNNQGNSLLKINQGIPKNQGKEGQGLGICATWEVSLLGLWVPARSLVEMPPKS